MAIERHPALHFKEIRKGLLQCELCPHMCVMHNGEEGRCRSRINEEGRLFATNYAQSIGISYDPIEKKPLYHFRPGSRILSLGPNSCNLSCRFCQNYSISQYESATCAISIDDLYQLVIRETGPKQLAFTYTEPLTWYEYIWDFAHKYPEVDIVLVTNGFINQAPLAELLPYIRAMNIDLKSARDEFYQQECGGRVDPVKRCISQAFQAGIHLEITFLMIPGLNDSTQEVEQISKFIATLSDDIPLHISAYHPDFKMDIPPTNPKDIARAVATASQTLRYVYGGNTAQEELMQTKCPSCKSVLIQRSYAHCEQNISMDSKCPGCGNKIYGVYDS